MFCFHGDRTEGQSSPNDWQRGQPMRGGGVFLNGCGLAAELHLYRSTLTTTPSMHYSGSNTGMHLVWRCVGSADPELSRRRREEATCFHRRGEEESQRRLTLTGSEVWTQHWSVLRSERAEDAVVQNSPEPSNLNLFSSERSLSSGL